MCYKYFKKYFILFVVILIAIISLTCGKKKNQITIIGEASSNLDAMETLKSSYENLNNIEIDFKKHSFEDALTKSNQDFANHTGIYDIILQYNFSLTSFVTNNYVYLVDELKTNIPNNKFSFEADLFENAWKEVGYFYKDVNNPLEGEVIIGYPFASNTM